MDLIRGFGGNDQLLGNAGDDCLVGGDGNDEIIGNEGDDNMWGGDGNDAVDGGPDSDRLVGDMGDDLMSGNDGFFRHFLADVIAFPEPFAALGAEPRRRRRMGSPLRQLQVSPHRLVLLLEKRVQLGLQPGHVPLCLFVVHPVADLVYLVVEVSYLFLFDVADWVCQQLMTLVLRLAII